MLQAMLWKAMAFRQQGPARTPRSLAAAIGPVGREGAGWAARLWVASLPVRWDRD